MAESSKSPPIATPTVIASATTPITTVLPDTDEGPVIVEQDETQEQVEDDDFVVIEAHDEGFEDEVPFQRHRS